MTVRYALDRDRVGDIAKRLPANVGQELIEPVVDGVLHRSLAKHTVREIFTDKRVEIQQDIEQELRGAARRRTASCCARCSSATSICRRSTGPGLEGLLAEELATEKMRYTLQLKEKQVKEKALEADAAKIQREKAAEAAASEEIIAAKAREEAMKHVLPLKEKEIEQRRLEAEARKVQKMKDAEGDAEARKIESSAEADSRRKLSDADAYRIEVTGKAQSEQMARDSALIAKNPLLIQKTLADKLSRQDPGDRRAAGGGRLLRGRPDRHAAARPGGGGGRHQDRGGRQRQRGGVT